MVPKGLLHLSALGIPTTQAVTDSLRNKGVAGLQEASACRGGVGLQAAIQEMQIKGELQGCKEGGIWQQALDLLVPLHHHLLHHHPHHLQLPILPWDCTPWAD